MSDFIRFIGENIDVVLFGAAGSLLAVGFLWLIKNTFKKTHKYFQDYFDSYKAMDPLIKGSQGVHKYADMYYATFQVAWATNSIITFIIFIETIWIGIDTPNSIALLGFSGTVFFGAFYMFSRFSRLRAEAAMAHMAEHIRILSSDKIHSRDVA